MYDPHHVNDGYLPQSLERAGHLGMWKLSVMVGCTLTSRVGPHQRQIMPLRPYHGCYHADLPQKRIAIQRGDFWHHTCLRTAKCFATTRTAKSGCLHQVLKEDSTNCRDESCRRTLRARGIQVPYLLKETSAAGQFVLFRAVHPVHLQAADRDVEWWEMSVSEGQYSQKIYAEQVSAAYEVLAVFRLAWAQHLLTGFRSQTRSVLCS
jgi:hypothetical protein